MEVTFSKAKWSTRMLAFGADLFMMTVLALLLVLASQAILMKVPFYKNAGENIKNIQYESHLYIRSDKSEPLILCDYYNPTDEAGYAEACNEVDSALTAFYTDPKFFDQEDPNSGITIYNNQKLDTGYFIWSDESHTSIVKKADKTYTATYVIYAKLMKEDAVTYLMKNDAYISNTRTINLSFIFLILALPIVISVTIFEFIIPLIFRKGRRTLGKLLLKLAVVDRRGLSPTFPRFLCRFLIFLFFEVILSAVSFLIPLFVSIGMFAFSKNNQSFHDYMTQTFVVDVSDGAVYNTSKDLKEGKKKAEELEIKPEDVSYQ